MSNLTDLQFSFLVNPVPVVERHKYYLIPLFDKDGRRANQRMVADLDKLFKIDQPLQIGPAHPAYTKVGTHTVKEGDVLDVIDEQLEKEKQAEKPCPPNQIELLGAFCYLKAGQHHPRRLFKVVRDYMDENEMRKVDLAAAAGTLKYSAIPVSNNALHWVENPPETKWILQSKTRKGEPNYRYLMGGKEWVDNPAMAKRYPESAVDQMSASMVYNDFIEQQFIPEDEAPPLSEGSLYCYLVKESRNNENKPTLIFWHKNNTGTWTTDKVWARVFSKEEMMGETDARWEGAHFAPITNPHAAPPSPDSI